MAYILETTYREALLAAVFGGQALPAIPVAWSLGLYNGNPFAGGTEISGGAYTRLTKAAGFWSTGAGTPTTAEGAVGNTAELRFPASGTVGGTGWDFSAGGSLWLGLHGDDGVCRVAQEFTDRDIADKLVKPTDYLVADPGNVVFYCVNAPSSMSCALSLTLRKKIMRWLVGDPLTIPATWEWSLWKGSPFAGGAEVFDPGYGRLSRPNDATEWSASGASAVTLTDLRWPATGAPVREWGLVTHVALGPVGEQPHVALKLASPQPIGPNVPMELAAGKIVLTTIF